MVGATEGHGLHDSKVLMVLGFIWAILMLKKPKGVEGLEIKMMGARIRSKRQKV